MLLAFLVAWLVAKIAFVECVIPQRAAKRNPEPIAAELREHVPPGEPLYLFRLKDEGVMFYYSSAQRDCGAGEARRGATDSRPALRLSHPRELPPGAFAVLLRQEWEDGAAFGRLRLVHWMRDQQGDPLILVQAPVGQASSLSR